jgi:hypothetical protein
MTFCSLLGITIFIFFINCQDTSVQYSSDLDTLASWMNGSFSSAEQANLDSAFFDVRLQMIPIWHHRSDGYWFYVEQAIAQYQDKPYRQRVYHLFPSSDTSFQSDVYVFDNPLRFAGSWKKGKPLNRLPTDSLTLREGCSIFLQRDSSNSFVGSTLESDCLSTLRGASNATSEVIIKKSVLISWDRGFDSNGQQVWGAEKGGYIFKKIKNF